MPLKELDEYRSFMGKAEMHKALNTLVGILEGIALDCQISAIEMDELTNWYSLHAPLINQHPFSEIIPVLSDALSDGVLTQEEAEDILWVCRNILNSKEFSGYFCAITSSIQELEGVLHGIMADNVLTDDEIVSLRNWMDDHDFLRGTYPFDEIYSLIIAAREDGVVTEDERNMLRAFFATFIDTRESLNINTFEIQDIQSRYSIGGICAVDPEITFEGKIFCFTGTSSRATRKEIAQWIEDHGGAYRDSVTKQTDYLVVGADGNPCWTFACYGRKVEKALSLRKSGHGIVIVNEFDLWDAE